MSARNKPALVSLPCSVIGWEQFMGGMMAAVQMQKWLSEPNIRGPRSTTRLVVESLQDVCSWPNAKKDLLILTMAVIKLK